jgi:nucleotide-binding universal stress UspA family protein
MLCEELMNPILVALDGSTFAEASIPIAIGLARQLEAPIELVTVHEAAPGLHNISGSSAQEHELEREQVAQRHQAAVRTLNALRDRIAQRPDAPVVTMRVLAGVPAERLLEHAQECGARILVVTTHGLGGLSRQWMGSVTDALVRHATIPMVTVRPDVTHANVAVEALPDWSLNRVLVTLDGSIGAERILEPLSALLPESVEYRLMRVVSPQNPLLRVLLPTSEHERDLAEQRQRATTYLEGIAARLQAQGIRATHRIMTDSAPAQAIADGAHEPDVDLVAIATHGRGALGRIMLGSVADKVLRTADKPVLLYRVNERAAATQPAS